MKKEGDPIFEVLKTKLSNYFLICTTWQVQYIAWKISETCFLVCQSKSKETNQHKTTIAYDKETKNKF